MPAPPPPPPPQFNSSGPPAGDNRNMLLQSIRAGKTLKKTVTVDKSAPVISGRVKGGSTSPSFSANSRNNNSPNAASSSASHSSNGGAPMPLGDLFRSGMPKLKPIKDLRVNATEKNGHSVNNPSFLHSSPGSSHSIKRGPPPVPPPATQKPQVFNQAQTAVDSATTANSEGHHSPLIRGVAKSIVFPRAAATTTTSPSPQKPSPPPKKLNLTSNASVSRAQSMRLPRSPPILAPTPPSLHQSQDCLNEMAQPRTVTGRILRPPVARPPSPPIPRQMSGNAPTTATRAAPPPPSRVAVTAPCIPPPPPPLPHRPAPMHQRLAPPPPPPPTPPVRSLSVRNGQTPVTCVDLEVRFAEMFHTTSSLPPPEPFRGFAKVYSSRNGERNWHNTFLSTS